MKKFALLGSTAAAVAMLAAPAAQAAGSPYFPHGAQSVTHEAAGASTVYQSEPVWWCNNGDMEWAGAVRVEGKATSIKVHETRSGEFGWNDWNTQVIGNQWTVIAGKRGDTDPSWKGGWSGSTSLSVDGLSAGGWSFGSGSPETCKGLPTAPPALGQAPGAVVTPPSKPTTKPTPKPTKTTPAPKPTKTTTAPKPTSTVKPSHTATPTHAGTHTTVPGHTGVPVHPGHGTTTAPVPVTTSTATATAPAGTATAPASTGTHHAGGTTAPATSGNGPVVQTDNVGNGNALGMELGLAGAAIAAAGGALVVARRRQG